MGPTGVLHYSAAAIGAIFVVVAGFLLARSSANRGAAKTS
jgi:hypothetical protein